MGGLQNLKAMGNSRDLAELSNQWSIKSDHNFADATARDTYFTANPTELVEGLFIGLGAGYQQRIGTSWVDKTAILSTFADVMTVENETWEVV